MVTAKLDTGYRSKGLFGIWKYDFTERSADVPGELFQLDSWVYQPESEQQEAYLTGESVYRDFVYENYLDISPQLKAEMERLFAPDGGLDNIAQSRNGQILLTSQDAHAWTEIYMDGMGWIPVDFTPGFYYNTYALLRMAASAECQEDCSFAG